GTPGSGSAPAGAACLARAPGPGRGHTASSLRGIGRWPRRTAPQHATGRPGRGVVGSGGCPWGCLSCLLRIARRAARGGAAGTLEAFGQYPSPPYPSQVERQPVAVKLPGQAGVEHLGQLVALAVELVHVARGTSEGDVERQWRAIGPGLGD